MMKRFLSIAGTAMVLTIPAIADDQVDRTGALGIQADGLYSFATANMQKNGVVGGVLENITDQELVIVRAESDVSERVELHTHLHEDGIMKMREVESYTVPADGEFDLGPKAEHIMLMGLTSPLKQGDVFSVRLFDDKGANIEVPVLVRGPGDIPEDNHDGHDHGHHEH